MEREFIRWLGERLPRSLRGPLSLADDAALVELAAGQRVVATVDMLTEGVDFVWRQDSPERVGRKALAVNLSDLAAMAAKPLAGVVALALPREEGLELAQRLYEGLIPLAERYDLTIAGGDTNTWNGPLVISITLLGTVGESGPLLRSGAQPGDAIVVTGSFGGSSAVASVRLRAPHPLSRSGWPVAMSCMRGSIRVTGCRWTCRGCARRAAAARWWSCRRFRLPRMPGDGQRS